MCGKDDKATLKEEEEEEYYYYNIPNKNGYSVAKRRSKEANACGLRLTSGKVCSIEDDGKMKIEKDISCCWG